MLTPQAEVRDRESGEPAPHLWWGLGWGIQEGERGTAFWHWGDNGNFRCFVVAYPERTDGLVYFTNSNNGLAIARELTALAFDDTPWALRYLDYWTWDHPQRLARVALWRAFLSGDESQAWAVMDSVVAQLSDDVTETELVNLGQFLNREDRPATATAVLEWAASRSGSVRVFSALGESYTTSGDYERAITAFDRALALDPESAPDIEPRQAWLREGIEASRDPVRPRRGELQAYVGEYGPRRVELQDDTLRYSREGASTDVALVPLSHDVFRLETLYGFRMRFERDATGRVVRIVGLYADGSTDTTERTK
jgi:tetratricopeptide (TPR) repeat protein